MIPDFDDNGYLPPGIYPATLEEIADRFGQQSEVRTAQLESLRWLLDLARRAGVKRLVINGSFVTDVEEPNDVDCVLLMESATPAERHARSELKEGLPFLELHLVEAEDFAWLTNYFATIGYVPKGMVEVEL